MIYGVCVRQGRNHLPLSEHTSNHLKLPPILSFASSVI
jgi:hypothetical protein